MANHPSAEKRNRQRIVRTVRNRSITTHVRTLVKRVRTAIEAQDKAGAAAALKPAIVALDQAASKGVLHVKTVSRSISRLSAAVYALTK